MQEKLGASQDKNKLSHSNDWCAKTGSNTTPPNENCTLLDTPLRAQNLGLAKQNSLTHSLGGQARTRDEALAKSWTIQLTH
jgi:hypothetical protein